MDRRNHVSGQTGITGSSPVLTTKIKNYDTNIVCILYFVYLYGKKKTMNFSTCTAVSNGLS